MWRGVCYPISAIVGFPTARELDVAYSSTLLCLLLRAKSGLRGEEGFIMSKKSFVTRFVCLAVAGLLWAVAGYGQKNVAVYVTGQYDEGVDKVLTDKLCEAFTSGKEYRAIERMAGFLAAVNKELNYQRSGAVNDSLIAKLGEQFGAHFVCVAEVTNVLGEKYIAARLVDAKTSLIEKQANTTSKLSTMTELIQACARLKDGLTSSGTSSGSSAASSRSAAAPSSTPSSSSGSSTASRPKKVAVLPVVDRNREFNDGQKLVAKATLTDNITRLGGYAAYDRVNLSAITDEQQFLRTGNLDDGTISMIGAQYGMEYIVQIEMAAIDEATVVFKAQLINAETHAIEGAATTMGANNPNDFQSATNKLVQRLFK